MNATKRNIYHIFPLGFTEAPKINEQKETVNRISLIKDYIPYLKELGINTLLLGPVNESISHGYDTTDYYQIDRRLGTNEDFKDLVKTLHENDIEIIVDCVFNHVGRNHPFFLDLLKNRENSPYKDYFLDVNFFGNNEFNDNLSYANWAGHNSLVKLNLYNPAVKDYLKKILNFWIDEYDIDGIRLDAANVMDRGFLSELTDMARSKKAEFFSFGEIVGGNYTELIENGHLDSVTNYECYKGLYSSLNDKNYFEIAHSIRRLFDQGGGLLKTYPAVNFVDNHDVERVATTLRDKNLLYPLYLLLYTMPGIPSIYYGSEQAYEAKKENHSDDNLRPGYTQVNFDKKSKLYNFIKNLAKIREDHVALQEGVYQELFIQPETYGFKRLHNDSDVVVLLNMNEEDQTVQLDLNGNFNDLLNQERININNEVTIPAYSGRILKNG